MCTMSRSPALLAALLIPALALFPRAALAQWSGDPTVNTIVSRSWVAESSPRAIADGTNGVIVVWLADVGSLGELDLRAQRLDGLGFPLWASGGVDVTTAARDQRDQQIVSDGAGGVIVVWADERNLNTLSDIYAQHVNAAGVCLWGPDGLPICVENDYQAYPQMIADGAGGAIITWRDARNAPTSDVDIYAQRVSGAGAALWGAHGLPVCTASGQQVDPGVASDGAGGAIIAWSDARNTDTGYDIYAQRVNAAGVTQWMANGVGYLAYSNQSWTGGNNPVLPDGAHGAIVVYEDDFFGASDIDLRAVRFAGDGGFPWIPGSRWLCGATGIQRLGRPLGDGAGTVVVPWVDYRNGASNSDVYALSIDEGGTTPWGGEVALGSTAAPESGIDAAWDDIGGNTFAWYAGTSGLRDVFAQRVDAGGALLWPTSLAVCTAPRDQIDLAIVQAGTCGSIVSWRDYRWVGDPWNDTDWDIYAQRVYCDGSLIQRALVVDSPNGGEIWQGNSWHLIRWHGLDIANHDVRIDYSTNDGATWGFVAYVPEFGTSGEYDWHVPNVGSTQCRVRATVAGTPDVDDISDAVFTIVFDPSGVEASDRPFEVALGPAYPNPASGAVAFRWGLPERGRVTLGVYDVRGRLVRTLVDREAPPGWSEALWDRAGDSGERVPPGLYWIRLCALGKTIVRRTVIVN